MIRNCQLSTDRIMEEIFFILMLTILGFSEGEPTYPTTVIVSSTGGVADLQAESLGVYTKTAHTYSGRPVWQSTVRDDRFLFYSGTTLNMFR